jgi:hypothetical protein
MSKDANFAVDRQRGRKRSAEYEKQKYVTEIRLGIPRSHTRVISAIRRRNRSSARGHRSDYRRR